MVDLVKQVSNLELYQIFKGDVSRYFLRAVAAFFVLALAYTFIPILTDSTDDGRDRSGVSLRIDNLTGCHYLEGAGGGITPRVDKEGTHICTGQEQ